MDNIVLFIIDQDNGITVLERNCFIDEKPSMKQFLCFFVMVMQEKMITEYLVTPIICIKICGLS